METIKQLQKWTTELYLLASVIFYWVSTANVLNPVAVSFLAMLGILFLWKNEVLGILISVIFLIISLYMVLALISELSEFPEFNLDAKKMLFVCGAWLGLNILLSIIMMIKWGKKASLPRSETNYEAATQ